MWDICAYTDRGGHAVNYDVIAYQTEKEELFIVLCDGMNGACGGDKAAQFITDRIMAGISAGASPAEALTDARANYEVYRQDYPELKKACTTVCALKVSGNEVSWINLGDSRLYLFHEGELARKSYDDSAAYQSYLSGEVPYEDIRMLPFRSRLTGAVGDGSNAEAHTENFELCNGDSFIVCSDGFWQYVYETEMEIDLHKAQDASVWRDAMLLRLAHRSHMAGDNISVICCMNDEFSTDKGD